MPVSRHRLASVATPPDQRLERALQALCPGPWNLCERRPGAACHRAELELGDADPLTFLRHLGADGSLPAGGGCYWSDRSHSLECAGVGSAAEVTGEEGTPFTEVCAGVEALIGSPRQRLYGGFRFQGGQPAHGEEPWWTPFGSYRFTLPRIELARTPSGTALACNFHHDEQDTLSGLTHDLAARCRAAVQAARAGPAAPAERTNPVAACTHVPDQSRWRQLVAAVLQRFGSCLDGGSDPLEKIVLARRTTLQFRARICALTLLQRLRMVNPAAYHFALQPPSGVTFFGASPERLLQDLR